MLTNFIRTNNTITNLNFWYPDICYFTCIEYFFVNENLQASQDTGMRIPYLPERIAHNIFCALQHTYNIINIKWKILIHEYNFFLYIRVKSACLYQNLHTSSSNPIIIPVTIFILCLYLERVLSYLYQIYCPRQQHQTNSYFKNNFYDDVLIFRKFG